MGISLFTWVHRCGGDGESKKQKTKRKLSEVMIAAGSGHILSKRLHDATQRRGRLRLLPLRFSPSSQEPQLHSLSYLKVSAGAQSAAFSPLGSLVARCSSVPEPVWAHHRSGPGLKDLILTSALRLANVTIYSYFVNRCAAQCSA